MENVFSFNRGKLVDPATVGDQTQSTTPEMTAEQRRQAMHDTIAEEWVKYATTIETEIKAGKIECVVVLSTETGAFGDLISFGRNESTHLLGILEIAKNRLINYMFDGQ